MFEALLPFHLPSCSWACPLLPCPRPCLLRPRLSWLLNPPLFFKEAWALRACYNGSSCLLFYLSSWAYREPSNSSRLMESRSFDSSIACSQTLGSRNWECFLSHEHILFYLHISLFSWRSSLLLNNNSKLIWIPSFSKLQRLFLVIEALSSSLYRHLG